MAIQKKSGFTLIELLVVIAIIAILAAILFPVFAQAREKARQITCASNMKQIGLALLQYQQDYDESFPITVGEYTLSGVWIPVYTTNSANWQAPAATWDINIESYTKNMQVEECPDDTRSAYLLAPMAGDPAGAGAYHSYGLCENLVGAALGKMPSPAETLMMADAVTGSAGKRDGFYPGNWWWFWNIGGTDGYIDGTPSIDYRHAGGTLANFLFADGHVKAIQGTNASTGHPFGTFEQLPGYSIAAGNYSNSYGDMCFGNWPPSNETAVPFPD